MAPPLTDNVKSSATIIAMEKRKRNATEASSKMLHGRVLPRDAKPGAQFIRSSCYIFNCSTQMADVQQTFQTAEINKRWKIAEIQNGIKTTTHMK